MLKFLRLTDSLRKFSQFELSSLFQVSAKTSTVMSSAASVIISTKSAPIDKVATAASTAPNAVGTDTIDAAKSVDTIENIDGVVKFLELVGNLKVSEQ